MSDETPINGSSKVVYTVKEVLAGIDSKLAGIDTKLDSKADKSDLVGLAARVEDHSKRLDVHEYKFNEAEKEAKKRKEDRRFRVPFFTSLALNLAGPFLWYVVYHAL